MAVTAQAKETGATMSEPTTRTPELWSDEAAEKLMAETNEKADAIAGNCARSFLDDALGPWFEAVAVAFEAEDLDILRKGSEDLLGMLAPMSTPPKVRAKA